MQIILFEVKDTKKKVRLVDVKIILVGEHKINIWTVFLCFQTITNKINTAKFKNLFRDLETVDFLEEQCVLGWFEKF